MAEMATAVRYHLPIKVVIVKNNYLGQITWEQMVFPKNPEYEVDLRPIDFALSAQACGAPGFRIEDPATRGAMLDEALPTPGPVVHVAQALANGEPDRLDILRQALGGKIRELV